MNEILESYFEDIEQNLKETNFPEDELENRLSLIYICFEDNDAEFSRFEKFFDESRLPSMCMEKFIELVSMKNIEDDDIEYEFSQVLNALKLQALNNSEKSIEQINYNLKTLEKIRKENYEKKQEILKKVFPGYESGGFFDSEEFYFVFYDCLDKINIDRKNVRQIKSNYKTITKALKNFYDIDWIDPDTIEKEIDKYL